jgi:DNA-binding response OmpR family regulator
MHVLLVEDEPNIAEAMRFILTRDGWRVSHVADGNLVLGQLRRDPPDLVILDINMPRFDGFYVLEMAKKINTCPRAKILMCSTKVFEQDLNRAKTLGADDFLIKPFNADELLAKVLALIGAP